MPRKRGRESTEVNAGSMADIAFLLLIFFLVTTTIANDKGLSFGLPPKPDPNEPPPEVKLKQKNIFKVLVNSQDRILVEDEPFTDMNSLKGRVKEFVMNNGKNPELSDSPKDAIVSLKTDRGSSYGLFINILDEIQAAYYEIYAERVGISAEEFRALGTKDPKEKELRTRAREGIPMNISFAKQSKSGGK